MSYQEHIKYFGSPEAYAKAILEKEKSGQTLSNPEEAAAFKQANPQLFNPAPTVNKLPTGPSYQGHLNWFGSPEAYAETIMQKRQSGQALSNPAEAAAFERDYAHLFQPKQPVNKFPYQSFIEGLMGSIPQWNQDPEKMKQEASLWANLQVDPQISALNKALEQALANAKQQEETIKASYAGIPQALEQQEQRQSKSDLESAISRGAARSGVVDWQSRNRQEHFNNILSQSEAQKAAQLSGVANQQALTQQQALQAMQELEARRGQLAQSFLSQLGDTGYNRSMQGWQAQVDLASLLAGLASNQSNQNWSQSQDVLNRTTLTPWERIQAYIQLSGLTGTTPNGMLDLFGNMK